ncbi:MAG: sodium:proton antiporter, partial [Methylibium sp.]|nr:sodium:proton antiporter [Methylibium sp.]
MANTTLHLRRVARCRRALLALVGCLPVAAGAAEIDGSALGVAWALPFAGLLLSIALVPLLAPGFWHRHYGKVALGWAAAFMLPFAALVGVGVAAAALVHAALA